ncbi:unnamed protein product [Nippostrongylus brasiliensis]|uniref:Reverse transcriptase domain-containing protein n=1 Tax=Nippostrongylus brasiliensis TaxID=27835 RepID=A0A0N4YXL3_NIPBR|nr:unnamed protein product [Nippostrongylus brasiliensis]
MWTPLELERLRALAERHKASRGIRWKSLTMEWETQRSPSDPLRTIPAMQKALRGLAPRRVQAQQATSSQSDAIAAREIEEQPTSELAPQEHQIGSEPNSEPTRQFVDESRQGTILWTEPSADLKTAMETRFNDFYRTALKSQDRQPIRRPKREISKVLLQVGNEILREKLSTKRCPGNKAISMLNAAVYAVGKATTSLINDQEMGKVGKNRQRKREAEKHRNTLLSFVSALSNELTRRENAERGPPCEIYLEIAKLHGISSTNEVQRLLRKLKDELHIVNQEIEKTETAIMRYNERRRGYPAVAREPRESNIQTPVQEVREYWKGINQALEGDGPRWYSGILVETPPRSEAEAQTMV